MSLLLGDSRNFLKVASGQRVSAKSIAVNINVNQFGFAFPHNVCSREVARPKPKSFS